jgi:hypothetical protein
VVYGGPRQRGYGRSSARRRIWPALSAVVVVIAAVAIVLGVMHVRDNQRKARNRSQAEAVAVTKSYLGSWSAGNATLMAADATPTSASDVMQRIPPEITSLQISKAVYTPTLTTTRKGPTQSTFHAVVTVQGLGNWTYNGVLPLQKVSGHWKIAFTPEAIYPDLHAGDQLVRDRELGTRGQLVLANGTPVRGQDTELTGNLIGTVGPYTAALAQAAGPFYLKGDPGGISGLERGYNATLAGTPGGSLTIRSSTGAVRRTLISRPVVNGKNVVLSLDLGVQRAAESAMAGVPANLPSSMVAIDTTTGKVLALVNHPIDSFGKAIRGTFPPGSTFKIITTTAALLSGRTAATPLACTPTATVDGRVFKNAENEAYGTISLATAFAKSCNTAFVNLGASLPSGELGKAAALFGFSTNTNTAGPSATAGPLPLTSFGGNVPAPTDLADRAAESIGQGRILTSPLQMASVAAAVASGVWRQPFVSAAAPTGNPQHAIPAVVLTNLRSFMGLVVSSGTAAGSGLPAGTLGKTGTAEVGTKNPPDTVGWFIGYRGNIAFACQVGQDGASGGFGADTAAPAVARFLRALG